VHKCVKNLILKQKSIERYFKPYSRELINEEESNQLEKVLLDGTAAMEGVSLSDDMLRSYICTAHLRVIRQLNCTIRGTKYLRIFVNVIICEIQPFLSVILKIYF
jgi:hypothetical protein